MQSLEALERGTAEFQNLTPLQQTERRRSLSIMLNIILEQRSSVGLTRQEAGRSVGDLLEFHLTGRVDRVTEKQKTPRKRKK